ncbi:hypothetical protein GCM10012275_40650 [Longimycelium tulufanense]|uniref:Uncharacterized protein n=1 Tax=Longimycelium tulufanense TaxID=907463 RepID=A0A8J3CE60_9PSEU|nr:hypothetical protein [Longimycelium tulufanense]GGM65911.1 hypothetical protein GCM10012275_40650 [Longimycelium tulufanense]
MGKRAHAVLGSLLVGAFLAIAVPGSAQEEGGTRPTDAPVWIKVSPDHAEAGDRVQVQAACEALSWGPVVSDALRAETLERPAEGHQPWALYAQATVLDVTPGTYPVSFRCGRGRADTAVTVFNAGTVRVVTKSETGAGDGEDGPKEGGVLALMIAGGVVLVALAGAGVALTRHRSGRR